MVRHLDLEPLSLVCGPTGRRYLDNTGVIKGRYCWIKFGVCPYRDQFRGGFISYGQAVGSGVIISLYSSIIGALFTMVLYTLIDPDLMDKFYAFNEQQMLDRGSPEEAVEIGMNVTRKLFTPETLSLFSIFGGVMGGTIFSLIIAIFLKKEGGEIPVETPAE